MKKKCYLALVLVLLMSMGLSLTGCRIFTTKYEKESKDDDDDDDDDEKDGNTNTSNVGGNGVGGYSYSGTNDMLEATVIPGTMSEQYCLLANAMSYWYLGDNIDPDMQEVTYGISDLDNNGRLELIRKIAGATIEDSSMLILEVNEAVDGLDVVNIQSDGRTFPDISETYNGYENDEGLYYIDNGYCQIGDDYLYEYFLVNMKDGVIYAEMFKYAEMDSETYEYTYYDKDGNQIESDEFWALNETALLGKVDYVSLAVSMQTDAKIAYPKKYASMVDLYYFAEHGYNTFWDRNLSYGDYDGDITFYTNPSSAEYQELVDVVTINEGAKGVPIRFKMSADTEFGIADGYWLKELECLASNPVTPRLYYNRTYEVIVDLHDGDITQAIYWGTSVFSVNKENFSEGKGTYTVDMTSYYENDVYDGSRYTEALGIVAYEIYKAGDVEAFDGNDELYLKTVAEVITYLYQPKDKIALSSFYYDLVTTSFFNWDWDSRYIEVPERNSVVQYHMVTSSDGCDFLTDDITDYFGNEAHYVIESTDYTEALEAIKSTDIDFLGDVPLMITYSFENKDGSMTKVVVDVSRFKYAGYNLESIYMAIE